MLKELFNKIINFFAKIVQSKEKKKQEYVDIVIDPMEPFEKVAEERRLATWYDIDVTQGTIRYKI